MRGPLPFLLTDCTATDCKAHAGMTIVSPTLATAMPPASGACAARPTAAALWTPTLSAA